MTSNMIDGRTIAQLTAGRGRGPGGQPKALSQRTGCCPISGCYEEIDPSRLMCRTHWYFVPKQLRDRVWATWRSGDGASSRDHEDAVLMAMSACQEQPDVHKPSAA
jgi:hypothetical protein